MYKTIELVINYNYNKFERKRFIMIIEFSVTNFLSFKDKVTFSMLADSKDNLQDNYVIKDNRKILKTTAIYGANASGKTK